MIKIESINIRVIIGVFKKDWIFLIEIKKYNIENKLIYYLTKT